MRVSVFGLGYVGVVTAACLARDGHDVIGVDVNSQKVASVAGGRSPIIEAGIDELLARGVADGRITASSDAARAVESSDLSLIAVGTPSLPDGEPNLDHVLRVCDEIGVALRTKTTEHAVVLRSTVPPGTLDRCAAAFSDSVVPVHLAFNPEFLREGSAVSDFGRPPYTVIGTDDPVAEQVLRELYANVPAPVLVVRPGVAEMLKYVANAWHATKIVFSNEVGRLAEACGVDGHKVMDIIAQDTKLNVSTAYMCPGFAYGGSCLPKDVGGLLHQARRLGVTVPLLSSLPASNAAHIELAVQAVLEYRPTRVAVLGLAFKSGTDDLRDSPVVPLVKKLIGEGCNVSIFDRHVRPACLTGTNLGYIRANLPHFEALLADEPEQIVRDADVVVMAHATPEIVDLLASTNGEKPIIDLANVLARTSRECLVL